MTDDFTNDSAFEATFRQAKPYRFGLAAWVIWFAIGIMGVLGWLIAGALGK